MVETRTLTIVDVRPTFCESGALAVKGGSTTIERIAGFITKDTDEYTMIVATQDWHVSPGSHFSEDPDFISTRPPHALMGTAEIELHKVVASLPIDVAVEKGKYGAAYSGFESRDADGRLLEEILRAAEIEEAGVVRITGSHCVEETALDILKAGWPTRVPSDLIVSISEEFGIAAYTEVDEAGAEQVASMNAFGFYEEGEDVPIPGDDASLTGVTGGNAYGSLCGSDSGYADGTDTDAYGKEGTLCDGDPHSDGGDRYGDLDGDGEEPDLVIRLMAGLDVRLSLSSEADDVDLDDFDIDIDEETGFSGDVDEADSDLSDIDGVPTL